MSVFDASQFMFNNPEFYNGVVKNSVRLNGSTTHFRRTLSSGGNRRKVTYSFWLKHGSTRQTNYNPIIFSKGNNVPYSDSIYFQIRYTGNTGDIYMRSTIDDAQTALIVSNRRFNDAAQWYHFLLAFDTEQSTNTDRMKLYVNGVQQTSFSSVAYPSQNQDMAFGWYGSNSGNDEVIGDYDASEQASYHTNGYLAEFHYVDGQQLTPSSFGEFKNGIWIPIEYTGSHGSIGYHLKFDQTGTGTASSSTIGADSSGNNGHFTSSGIVASDCNCIDSPENTFATFNPLLKANSGTLSYGMLKNTAFGGGSSTYSFVGSTMSATSGKYYMEYIINNVNTPTSSYSGPMLFRNDNTHRYGREIGVIYDGHIVVDGVYVQSGLTTQTGNDIFGFAVDLDNKTVDITRNGSAYGTQVNFSSHTYVNQRFIGIGCFGASSVSTSTITVNYGQDSTFIGVVSAGGHTDQNGIGDFKYAPPSGYLAFCTANLPDTTLSPNQSEQATDHFNTLLYTGNSTNNRAITGLGFQPDWVWIKKRNGNMSHFVVDSSRGLASNGSGNGNFRQLATNATYHEEDTSNNTSDGGMASFDADGFTLGKGSNDANANSAYQRNNANSSTYVAWNWKANGGTKTTVSIGDISSGVPSIASEVQANTKAGFSIVLYTGTGASSGTIAHGLGAVPKQIWVKNRDAAYNWKVYHGENTSAPETDYLVLDNTDATVDSATHWNDTAPDANVFTIGSSNGLIRNNDKYVAYCFAEIEGYSKIGSYTGNGSTDGPFVFTGFRPAWIIVKRTNGAGNWILYDNTRDAFNDNGSQYLYANLSNAEPSDGKVDFVSNGFKQRSPSSYTDDNASGSNYIYMAFAEAPFKFANAR